MVGVRRSPTTDVFEEVAGHNDIGRRPANALLRTIAEGIDPDSDTDPDTEKDKSHENV